MASMNSGSVCLLVVLALAGCSAPQPLAENFSVSHQKVARTAKHWEVVANDVVTQTADMLAKSSGLQNRTVFVPMTSRNTAFDAVFRDFLINEIVNRGIDVNVCASPPLVGIGFAASPQLRIRYDTRILGHSEAMQYRPGLLTALASGVFVGRAIGSMDLSRDAMNAVAVGLGVVGDIWSSQLAKATRTEIIVTTSVEENNRFLMRRADIYYVPEGDANLFVQGVAKNSSCVNDDETTPRRAENRRDKTDDEMARKQMFERDMKRRNPNWTAPPQAFAY